MTAERETMTERQAFVKFWSERMRNVPPQGPVPTPKELSYEAWQAAIAHLSSAAEPVAWTRTDTINDASGCPIGMDEPRIHWGRYYPDGDCGWSPLYTHPPEPARDAKRLDWLVRKIPGLTVRKIVGYLPYTGDLDVWRERIDAAMAQESDNG